MKRKLMLALITVSLVAALAFPASAYYLGFRGRGLLAPYALYNNSGVDTVVGIFAAPLAGYDIYWAFFSENGILLAADVLRMQDNVFDYSFTMAGTLGPMGIGEDTPGYLVFTWDDDGVLATGDKDPRIFGAAFLIDLSASDAAFIPVVALPRANYANTALDLLAPPSNFIINVSFGNSEDKNVGVRFLVDPDGGFDSSTALIIFTPGDAPTRFILDITTPSGALIQNVEIQSVARRLNIIDLGSIDGIPSDTGTAIVHNPDTLPAGSAGFAPTSLGAVFGISQSSIIGARQTILGISDPEDLF